MRISAIVWILCVLATIGLLAWMGTGMIPQGRTQTSPGTALVGGDFTLSDKNGKQITPQNFSGKYMLVYFGFTHCPDICPTGLLLIENAIDQLGSKGNKIVPLFITVDPERDTAKVVGDYVAHFGKRIVGLSGTPEQIKHVADAYKVYYRKVDDKDAADGYMIDHSGYIYLMGPDGKYLAHFPHHISESALKDGLAKFVR